MGYTLLGLKNQIEEIHPEIIRHGLVLNVSFSQEKNAYMLKLTKGGNDLVTYLDKKDADDCMDGRKCVNLALQLGQFLADFEDLATPRKPG
jgi:hypothetical protein